MRALAATLCLCLPSSVPDVLMPGYVSARHELVLNWDEGITNRFVASPTRGFGSFQVIAAGEPFPFSSKYGTRIYAVPADGPVPDANTLRESTWPNASIPVRQMAAVPLGFPVAHVVTSLRVAGLRDDGFELQVVGEQRFGRFGLPVVGPVWLPLVLIAGLGFVLLARCRAAAEPQR